MYVKYGHIMNVSFKIHGSHESLKIHEVTKNFNVLIKGRWAYV